MNSHPSATDIRLGEQVFCSTGSYGYVVRLLPFSVGLGEQPDGKVLEIHDRERFVRERGALRLKPEESNG